MKTLRYRTAGAIWDTWSYNDITGEISVALRCADGLVRGFSSDTWNIIDGRLQMMGFDCEFQLEGGPEL